MDKDEIIKECREYISTEMWRKKRELEGLDILLNKIDNYLKENCEHKWIYDDIDSISKLKNTVYCKKCNIYLK